MNNMVVDEVCRTPTATSLVITLFANKSFLSRHLFNKDGEGLVEFLKGAKVNQMLLKFTLLCSLNIRNFVVSSKHHLNNLSPIDCILKLKALSSYNYIKDNYFLDQ
jgi:hypothetical protein